MSAYRSYSNLTQAEKLFLSKNPIHKASILANALLAKMETSKRFTSGGHNDEADAFRHCYWSALMAKDLGAFKAEQFSTLHEQQPGNPAGEKAMDLHNNAVGIKLGSKANFWSYQNLSDACYGAIKNGMLKTRP